MAPSKRTNPSPFEDRARQRWISRNERLNNREVLDNVGITESEAPVQDNTHTDSDLDGLWQLDLEVNQGTSAVVDVIVETPVEVNFAESTSQLTRGVDRPPGYWKMRNNKFIAIRDMEDSHLENTVLLLERNANSRNRRLTETPGSAYSELKQEIRRRSQNVQAREHGLWLGLQRPSDVRQELGPAERSIVEQRRRQLAQLNELRRLDQARIENEIRTAPQSSDEQRQLDQARSIAEAQRSAQAVFLAQRAHAEQRAAEQRAAEERNSRTRILFTGIGSGSLGIPLRAGIQPWESQENTATPEPETITRPVGRRIKT